MLTRTHATFFIIGFVIYVLLMVGVGIVCSKGKSKGKDYLTGGGRMPLYLIFATMGATLIGTGSSIGATANGFKNGFGGSAYGMGAALGILALVLVAKKTKLRSKNFLTMAEEAQFHYNGNNMVKSVMSFMMYIIEVVWLGNHINGGATYLSYVTGLDLTTSKMIAVLAFGGYVIIGGYLAVVWTDLIQLTILIIGFISITVIAIPAAGGWDGITQTIIGAGKAGNLSLYGIETMGTMAVISLMFSVAIPCLGTPTYRMRIYTAKDDKTAIRALSLSGWLLLTFSFLPAIIGMAAFTIATNTGAQAVLEKPDFAFAYIATTVLSPVLGLMFMIAGLSATMSSGDSDAIAGVTILIQDIYPVFTGRQLEEEKVGKYSRIATAGTLLLAFFATLFAKDVMGYISNVIGSIIPGVSVAMLLGACWKRATWQGGLASVGVGTLFGVLYLTVPVFSAAIVSMFKGPAIPVTLVALAAEVIVSLCTKKEEMSEERRLALVVESRGAGK
ncbi:sodium:solute symporter family protein [Clostridiales bacterium COT073_COT-073]|nr:sodium:solute symporter family protein [Clostridiales bacterium COT073_COT-073]